MEEKGLGNIFEKFLSQESLFKDKKVLQSSYTPDALLHRDEEINQLAKILDTHKKEAGLKVIRVEHRLLNRQTIKRELHVLTLRSELDKSRASQIESLII